MADKFEDTSFLNISKVITENCDGVNVAVENLATDLREIFDASDCHKMDYGNEENQSKEYSLFFDRVIENVLA